MREDIFFSKCVLQNSLRCLTERRYSIERSLLVDSMNSKRKSKTCRHNLEKHSEKGPEGSVAGFATVLCPHIVPRELRMEKGIRRMFYGPNSNLEFSKIRSRYTNGCV